MPQQLSRPHSIYQQLSASAAYIASVWRQQHSEYAEFADTLIISVSDGVQKAKTHTLRVTPEALQQEKWPEVLPQIHAVIGRLAQRFRRPLIWCRIEWVNQASKTTWGEFQQELKRYKRNYFRRGLIVAGVREPWLLMGEAELNAGACFYAGNKIPHAQVYQPNFLAYFKARHGSSQLPEFTDTLPVWTFNTAGIFIDITEMPLTCHRLSTRAREWSRRELAPLSFESTGLFIAKSTAYLARQIGDDGRYIYGYFPSFNRQINFYNSLRHASSTYALIEGYEACLKQQLLSEVELAEIKARIKRALDYLCNHLIQEQDDAAYVVDTGGLIKLGANAVAILAMSKYSEVMQERHYLPLMHKLAQGILNMQEEDGSFVHVLDAKTLAVKEKSRIIYYDGEAAFALMRLYGLTKEQAWLDGVVRAFDYFIRANHAKAHDHWLSYCSNELIKYKPERKYFEFAVNNIKGYVDFIRKRLTTFPTLLELSMAFHQVLMKLENFPQYRDVLQGFDVSDFYQALHIRANYLLNGFFFPEMAMFFKSPQTILDSFFIRHHAFRVRIDDVEHYLSGLVAYQKLMAEHKYPEYLSTLPQDNKVHSKSHILSPEILAQITNGHWLVRPKKPWQPTGLCTWRPAFKPGHILVARKPGTPREGLLPGNVNYLSTQGASALICTNPQAFTKLNIPKLVVTDSAEAIAQIGQHVRSHFSGIVIGVTGSVGKTTVVAMIHQVLSQFYNVAQTAENANILHGIAWNMASMPNDADYWILETAIGKMRQNAELVKPHIAVINNVCAGHMDQAPTLEEIARQKSMLFNHMSAGSSVIINRDIEQFDIFAEKARQKNLTIITFGKSPQADIKVLQQSENQIKFEAKGEVYCCTTTLPEHLMMNMAAVFALAVTLNLPLVKVIKSLEHFQPLDGRGLLHHTTFNGKRLTVIDDSYNATPASMHAGLKYLKKVATHADNRVVILGDIAHLGSREVDFHLALEKTLDEIQANRVLLCGPLMKHLWEKIARRYCGGWYEDGSCLLPQLKNWLNDGDTVFIKGSMPAKMQMIANKLLK